ncbi:thioesterase II family protein [Actinoplanes siamensis]|uniref:Oleoyl-ACP hydrolase n=1 Tax=Actinoplanes siamensis TaxID=1223317 RepID=A0A919TNJ4_9ACTN|nr:alpha/beta fold hydrolase [Actinoplanes siamensis]GIF08258.1 oleoyl-ACP hydrolase [Actinoplanes siamensis]
MTAAQAGVGRWIRRYQPAATGAPRLLCLPHAGGSASFFVPTARSLAPDVEVLAAQYPGRQDRRFEPCAGSIAELVDGLVEELEPYLDQPLSIFGHSMGAVIGFELAGRLEREYDHSPEILFVSGRRAPSCLRDERVHVAGDDAIIAEVERLSGTDSRILGDEDMVRMVLPALRADYRAIERYRMSSTTAGLRCPIAVLTGDADPQVRLHEAEAWRGHTGGPFDLQLYPGGHFYLTSQAGAVLAYLRERLTARSDQR